MYKDQRLKISKQTQGCSLSDVGRLPFNFFYGACSVAKDEVYLCFDSLLQGGKLLDPKKGSGDLKTCWKSSDAVSTWTKVEYTIYYHRSINIAASDCK